MSEYKGVTPAWRQHLETIADAHSTGADPAHDGLHTRRVALLAAHIGAAEGAELSVAVPAALLHELFSYPKNHPNSAQSGEKRARLVRAKRGTPLLAPVVPPSAGSPLKGGYGISPPPSSKSPMLNQLPPS